MNPKNSQKRSKFACACCLKREDFDSNEVIFDYFGKEFSEYEYIIENLAIRPAPKKLLDLVPVHSTNISKNSIYKVPGLQEPTSSDMSYRLKPLPTEHGDFQKPNPAGNIRESIQKADDFISLKILPDEAEPRKCGPCNPALNNYNPCSSYPYDNKPCGSCKLQAFPEKCKRLDMNMIPDVLDLRRTIKSKEYRTTKQILSDLCEASEQSLHIKPKNANPVSIPTEIKNTIETLKFKKPLPQFFTRTEKKLFHKPGVYFADVTQDISNDEDNTITETNQEDKPNISAEQRLKNQSGIKRMSNQSGEHGSNNQSGPIRPSNQLGSPRLSMKTGEERLSKQLGQVNGRLTGKNKLPNIESRESDITIDDLSEHTYENNGSKPTDKSDVYKAVDSTVQTDISKQCPCPKKSKNLKWKIIINKHSNCKC